MLLLARQHRAEIDLIMQSDQGLLPVEVKSGQTIAADWFKNLHKWQTLNENSRQPQLIYGGDKTYVRNEVACQSWEAMSFSCRSWR